MTYELYDDNPKGKPITSGTGFASASKARKTLDLIKNKPLNYQKQVVTTMYYRAKHHPHQTRGMRNAMKIFRLQKKEWSKNKTRKQRS